MSNLIGIILDGPAKLKESYLLYFAGKFSNDDDLLAVRTQVGHEHVLVEEDRTVIVNTVMVNYNLGNN